MCYARKPYKNTGHENTPTTTTDGSVDFRRWCCPFALLGGSGFLLGYVKFFMTHFFISTAKFCVQLLLFFITQKCNFFQAELRVTEPNPLPRLDSVTRCALFSSYRGQKIITKVKLLSPKQNVADISSHPSVFAFSNANCVCTRTTEQPNNHPSKETKRQK